MSPGVLLAVYCALILVASLAGGWLPTRWRMTHTRMQALMSFLGGIMMGVGTLHLLPHAIEHAGSVNIGVTSLLGGLLGMLVLVRCFHFHQHDLPGTPGHSHHHSGDCEHPVATPGPLTTDDDDGPHSHDHDHDAGYEHDAGHEHGHRHDHGRVADGSSGETNLGWLGLFAGLVVHSLLDGVALGASLSATGHLSGTAALAGLGTFIAVFLHKPLDSLSLISLMSLRGVSPGSIRIVNLGFALVCPLGALVSYLRFGQLSGGESTLLGVALGVSAGIFLCIALVDVVPEIQFHVHDRLKLTCSLVLGVLVAWLIVQFEPAHDHVDSDAHRGSFHEPAE
jgi:zinc and cadmium transporter